jgi:hypothetical protein
VSFIVCVVLCAVSFNRSVILCDVRYLFVVFYSNTTATGKTPFVVKINKLINNNNNNKRNILDGTKIASL